MYTKRLVAGSVLCIAAFFAPLECDGRDTTFRWNDKAGIVELSLGGNTVRVRPKHAASVMDWSDDYSRSEQGTAHVLLERVVLFSGSINHSRSIVFVYDIKTGDLAEYPNIAELMLDEKWGWVGLREPPLYSAENQSADATVDVVVNGVVTATAPRSRVKSVGWDHGNGDVIVVLAGST